MRDDVQHGAEPVAPFVASGQRGSPGGPHTVALPSAGDFSELSASRA
jgi:hypothetical protein